MRQVESTHYDFLAYNNPARFGSYYYQMALILESGCGTLLEIGRGDGFLKRNLSATHIEITTCDFDESLKPQTVGDVRKLPFRGTSFETVCAFQVLEHLPWDELAPAVNEMKRCASETVLISLPDAGPYIKLQSKLPFLGTRRGLFDLGWIWRPTHRFDGQHYWEVGAKGYSHQAVLAHLESPEWVVEHTVRLFANPYHRFYRLRRTGGAAGGRVGLRT
jgi:hypothetical protein